MANFYFCNVLITLRQSCLKISRVWLKRAKFANYTVKIRDPSLFCYTLATAIFVIYSHRRVYKREPAVNGCIVSTFLSLGLGFHSVTPTISFHYPPHILQPAQVFWVFVTRKGSSNTKLSRQNGIRQNGIRQNGIRWSRNKLFFSWKGGGLGVRLEWYHLLKWTWKFTSLAVTLHISFQQPDSQFSAHNKTLNFLHAKVIQAIFVTPLCYSHFYPTIRCHLFCNLTHLSLVPYTIQTDKPQSSLLTNIQGFTVFSCITSPVSC